MTTEHVLKVAEPYFASIVDGSKTFEVRRNDRAYQTGDTLVLLDLSVCGCTYLHCSARHGGTRGVARRTVTFVYAGDPRFGGHGGLQPGYVVLGLGNHD